MLQTLRWPTPMRRHWQMPSRLLRRQRSPIPPRLHSKRANVMKFRYVGAESVPGSGRTKVFGNIDVAVGGVFDCPDHLIGRAKRHPHFEAVIDPHGTDITIGNQLPVIVADVRMMAPDDSKRDVTTVADITPSDVTVTSPEAAPAPRPGV